MAFESLSKHSLLPIVLLAQLSSLNPLNVRTALGGRPSWLSALLVVTGMQVPFQPNRLNDSEYPACAALTTGYVFRVENQAMVHYLRRMTQTGKLTHFTISSLISSSRNRDPNSEKVKPIRDSGLLNTFVYLPSAIILGCASLSIYKGISIEAYRSPFLQSLPNVIDQSTFLLFVPSLVISSLIISRLLTIVALRSQLKPQWHGASEPGVQGSLLILMSQDRWARMSGPVDDLKAVTSGSWLNPSQTKVRSIVDETMLQLSSLLVYFAVVLLGVADVRWQTAIVSWALSGHVLLSIANASTDKLLMHDREVALDKSVGEAGVKTYGRRLEMADELIKETGRRDWAVRLGMVGAEEKKEKGETRKDEGQEAVAKM